MVELTYLDRSRMAFGTSALNDMKHLLAVDRRGNQSRVAWSWKNYNRNLIGTSNRQKFSIRVEADLTYLELYVWGV